MQGIRHKKKRDAFWLNGKFKPPWVEAELAALAPGAVELNFHSWNSRMARCVKGKEHKRALELFREMQNEGMKVDRFTFVPVLNACASLRALEEGRQIHAQVIQSGLEPDLFVGSSIVNMYAKCGDSESARKVFDSLPEKDSAAWNPMILAFVKSGQAQKASELFKQMQSEGVEPNPVSFVGALNACASVKALLESRASCPKKH